MRPNATLQAIPVPSTAARAPDQSGIAAERQDVVRALDETRRARQTREVAKAATDALKQLESSLTGAPEEGSEDTVLARVVATSDAASNLPEVPLSGLSVRLKVEDEVVAREQTGATGMVGLRLPEREQGSYEVEVLGPACDVIACQTGRWNPQQRAPVHRIAVTRSDSIRPQLEKARPIEEGIKKAREHATIAAAVADKALAAQEKRLIEYLAEIDNALSGERDENTGEIGARAAGTSEEKPTPDQPEQPLEQAKRKSRRRPDSGKKQS